MKRTGMLVGNVEFYPKRRPIWAWFELYLTPKDTTLKTIDKIVVVRS